MTYLYKMSYITEYTQFTRKELLGKSGVYKILNKLDNKLYIGGAVDLYDRFRLHIGDLLSNSHHNCYLQGAVNKYGIENFLFEVIEYCPIETTFEREQYWIDFLKVLDKSIGYNLNSNTKTRLGAKLSNETKEKIRNALKGKKMSKERIEKSSKALREIICRKIIQFDLKGNFIREWDSISEAAIALKLIVTNISCNAKGINRRTGNFIFIYKENYDENRDYRYTSIVEERRKKVNMIDEFGNIIQTFNSVSEAALFVKGHKQGITAVCNGRKNSHGSIHKTYKGYKWEFIKI